MADNITLAIIKRRALERADMENSDFISDTELLSYINSSYSSLYDILVSRFEDYYTINTNSTVTSGNTIALPADFYKLSGVDFQVGGEWSAISKFNFQDRNRRTNQITTSNRHMPARQWRVIKSDLHILPENSATGTYRIWYVPAITRLSDDTDVVDAVNGWEEYIIVDTAIKMLTKEESDISALLMEKRSLENRIEAMAQNRDSEAEVITDMRPLAWEQSFSWWD